MTDQISKMNLKDQNYDFALKIIKLIDKLPYDDLVKTRENFYIFICHFNLLSLIFDF